MESKQVSGPLYHSEVSTAIEVTTKYSTKYSNNVWEGTQHRLGKSEEVTSKLVLPNSHHNPLAK